MSRNFSSGGVDIKQNVTCHKCKMHKKFNKDEEQKTSETLFLKLPSLLDAGFLRRFDEFNAAKNPTHNSNTKRNVYNAFIKQEILSLQKSLQEEVALRKEDPRPSPHPAHHEE